MTGRAEINLGGHEQFILCEIERATAHGGTRNLSQSGSNEQGEEQRFKVIFRPKSEIQAVFPTKNR